MELIQIKENLQNCSKESERIFTQIGSSFPSLLSINKSSEATSLSSLISLLESISDGFAGYKQDEVSFFEQNNAQNSTLFSSLSAKMNALVSISERVSAIRSDSEELEIIALNAMIVSIKSGENGRAFSCITENLKKLSAQMIDLSNSLILDQKKLMAKNELLTASFSSVIGTQKSLLITKNSSDNSDILGIIGSASESLKNLHETAGKISPPILDAMGGIQLQDIIRQSIDQMLLALSEIKSLSPSVSGEENLDRVTFNIKLLSISARICGDVLKNLESSIQIFSSNWDKVHTILDDVELLRVKFISAYLDIKDGQRMSLPVHLDRMNKGFSGYINNISQYQRGKRTMVRESVQIVVDVKHLRILFNSLHPVIDRLQHVRINQQIEVAKNAALGSITETVKNMSDLINQADLRVQEARKELVRFIDDIEELITGFSSESEVENRAIEVIKKDKNAFFGKMKEFEESLKSMIENLQVYPASFQRLCGEIDSMFSGLKALSDQIRDISQACDRHIEVANNERAKLLAESGLSDWTIKNSDFMNLVDRFTITSHKEAACEIGGFEIDKNSLDNIQSGDVTLFF